MNDSEKAMKLAGLAESLQDEGFHEADRASNAERGSIEQRNAAWNANNLLVVASNLNAQARNYAKTFELEKALRACRERFTEYVGNHLAKDVEEPCGVDETLEEREERRMANNPKAKRNQDMVDMISRVLVGGKVDG